MAITKPELPPKAGYVEVEIDGIRQYKKVYDASDEEIKKLRTEVEETTAYLVDASELALRSSVILADGNADANRVLAFDVSGLATKIPAKEWHEGMVTNPGDLVFDPDKIYTYIYSGKEAMTHSNPLFYPGSVGVYYWAVIPKMKSGIKIYPDISGIIVAVKKGETWWNTTADKKYKWVGEDNANCVWAPGTAPTIWTELID